MFTPKLFQRVVVIGMTIFFATSIQGQKPKTSHPKDPKPHMHLCAF